MKQVRITLCMLLLCLLCGCAKSTVTPNWAKQTTKPAGKTAATKDTQSSGWQEQYDLGVRYLSDGNYEDAIIAFTAAIEIDPKKPQAYDKLATAYERTGDEEKALRTLLDGAAATGDRALTARAEEKQKTLEDPTDRPASVTPDWTSHLAGVWYFGDASKCRMDAAAAEAYAAALEKLPETKVDEWSGETYTLMAALLDPGDGYPLMVTGYGKPSEYDEGWAVMFDPYSPYQFWFFNGAAAERYPLENESYLIVSIRFGTYEGMPAFCAQDGVSCAVGGSEGEVYYTVSQYQIVKQHHLYQHGAYVYDGNDPDILQYQTETVQDYLNEGWTEVMHDGDWCVLCRLELDGELICAGSADFDRLTNKYGEIQNNFRLNEKLVFDGSSLWGMISEPWSSAGEMCAALRGV